MKKSEIVVGGFYHAKVSNKIVVVEVLDIGKRQKTRWQSGGTWYSVRNTATGRQVSFKSAMKFRCVATKPGD